MAPRAQTSSRPSSASAVTACCSRSGCSDRTRESKR
jgi:hypothetical protein